MWAGFQEVACLCPGVSLRTLAISKWQMHWGMCAPQICNALGMCTAPRSSELVCYQEQGTF